MEQELLIGNESHVNYGSEHPLSLSVAQDALAPYSLSSGGPSTSALELMDRATEDEGEDMGDHGNEGLPPSADQLPQGEHNDSIPLQMDWSSLSISEHGAREALVQYTANKCCYRSAPAKHMVVQNLTPLNTFRYRLQTFTETRETFLISELYDGGFVDSSDVASAPAPWAMVVDAPPLFTDCEMHIPVPHTYSVQDCPNCQGHGKSQCHSCNGSGKFTCDLAPTRILPGSFIKAAKELIKDGDSVTTHSHISVNAELHDSASDKGLEFPEDPTYKRKTGPVGGKGYFHEYQLTGLDNCISTDRIDNEEGRTEDVQLVAGLAGKTHPIRVVYFAQVQERDAAQTVMVMVGGNASVAMEKASCYIILNLQSLEREIETSMFPHFPNRKNNIAEYVVDKNSGFPIYHLQEASGKEIFSDENQVVYPIVNFPEPTIDRGSESCIAQHQMQLASNSHILRQKQTIELIPLTKVEYEWRGKVFSFYVFGNENKVYAEDYPAKCCCSVM